LLFNSLTFIVFYSIVLIIYFRLNTKQQNILLLLAGFFFYSFWNLSMGFLLLFVIFLNYKLGRLIYLNNDTKIGSNFFKLGLVGNLLLLAYFKYTIFFLTSSNDIFYYLNIDFSIPLPKILLPVGISFYTFHNISYITDIKRKLIEPSKSLLEFSVYDLFFPLLLAGPIERPKSLLPQISNKRIINKDDFNHGILLFLWGLFKKVVIADNLSGFVDYAFRSNLEPGMISWVAFCFAFQVYADFSGYSDAARGMAKMMGFKLMLNFNLPFIASSVSEFWKRWHISLSSWLRDYVYIPLGGNKLGFIRQNLNILTVWTLGGLWHGATYGYFIWGLYCGLCIVLYNILNRFLLSNLNSYSYLFIISLKYLGVFFTFWSFAFGLLLFSVKDFDHLLNLASGSLGLYYNSNLFLKILILLLPLIIIEAEQFWNKKEEAFLWYKDHPILLGLTMIIGMFFFSFIGIYEKMEFFYFQF